MKETPKAFHAVHPCDFEDLLGLRYLIEVYMMSPREDNLESQYLLLAIAFEKLASYAQALAERNAEVIVNFLKQEKEKDIIYLSKVAFLSSWIVNAIASKYLICPIVARLIANCRFTRIPHGLF
jgi:hypothetical protein